MIKFTECPSVTIYDMFYKCENVLIKHKNIIFFNDYSEKSRIVLNILLEVQKYIKQDYDYIVSIEVVNENENCYVVFNDILSQLKNKEYEKALTNGEYDLIIGLDRLEELHLSEEEMKTASCTIDNSQLRIDTHTQVPDVYNPLFWFTKKDIEKYKEWKGIK